MVLEYSWKTLLGLQSFLLHFHVSYPRHREVVFWLAAQIYFSSQVFERWLYFRCRLWHPFRCINETLFMIVSVTPHTTWYYEVLGGKSLGFIFFFLSVTLWICLLQEKNAGYPLFWLSWDAGLLAEVSSNQLVVDKLLVVFAGSKTFLFLV